MPWRIQRKEREMVLGSWCGKYGGLPSSNGKTISFHMLSRANPFKEKVIILRLSQIRNRTAAPCFFQNIIGSGGGLLVLKDLAPRSHLPVFYLVLTLCQVHWPPIIPQTEQVCFCCRTCVPAATAAAQNALYLKVHTSIPSTSGSQFDGTT